ncbi:unnamed protein product [Ectocarpus sp. 8 AP-2014]
MRMMRKAVIALGVVLLISCLGIFRVWPGLRRHHVDPTGPVPTPAPTIPPFSFEYPAVVEKKTVSSRLRVMFLVGLEGTGHHYFLNVFDDVCTTAAVPCSKACPIAKALYPSLATPRTKQDYERARRELRRELENLAAYPAEFMTEGQATIAQFVTCRSKSGMMSFPNFNGNDKALQYVDFRLLAEEAERAGVDVRFVYLARSARSILISDTQHNHYGGTFMRESRALINNAAVVESTFQELGPGFATCFRYESMSDPEQTHRVARFIAPDDDTAQHLEEKMLENVKPGSASPRPESKPSNPTMEWTKQQGRLPNGAMNYHPNDPRYGPHRAKYDGNQFLKAGTAEQATELEAAAAEAAAEAAEAMEAERAKEEARERDSWDLSFELVVARLQQKLDKIEEVVCATTAATMGTSDGSA